MSKKAALAKLLHLSGFSEPLRRLIPDRLVIFNYHRIRPDDPGFKTEYDDNVYGPRAAVFRSHLEWLKSNARIVSEADLLGYLESGVVPPGLKVMITFDDGYIDNFTLAYPVLKELRVPAMFFIPTSMIENRRLGWWDISAYLLKNTGRVRIEHYGRSFDLEDERDAAIRYFHSIIQRMRPSAALEFLNDLAEYCDVAFPEPDQQGTQLMNWEQIRMLSGNGLTFGSHTHSHSTLSTLSPDEQTEEMIRSKIILKEITGSEINSIAYPLGAYSHISPDTARLAREAGYSAGFSYNTGVNLIHKMDRYDLRRMCGPDDIHLLISSALMPRLFTWS